MPSYVTFFDRDDPVSQGFRDNLYWWSKSCIQDYETMPYAGSGEDLLDFQKLTKERVADLEKDIKNLQFVQNEADGLTSTAIQLVISTIEKRRDLFAELLPKFQEQIDKGHIGNIYPYEALDGTRFHSLDDFIEYDPFEMYDEYEYYDEY